jgi:hypothetical protein
MNIYKLIAFCLLIIPTLVSAQPNPNDWGPQKVENVNLGTQDLGNTIAGIINIVLSFLGIIVTVGIIAGGLMYMTSGGNAERTDKGKDVLGASLIGLAIIVSAYAISRFVLNELFEQTVGTP